MTIVDKYASSWRQEIKSEKGSGLKRFRPSSDWQIEEFKGTCYCKEENDLPTESFCQLVFPKKFVTKASLFVINIGVTYNDPNNCWEELLIWQELFVVSEVLSQATRNISIPPWTGCQSIGGFTPSIKFAGTYLYTRPW